MRIAIIQVNKRALTNPTPAELLAQEAEKQNIQADKIYLSDLTLKIGEKTEIYHKNKPLENYDAIIIRANYISDPSIPKILTEKLKLKSKIIINSPESIAKSKNKIETLEILAKNNIPITDSIIIQDNKNLNEALEHINYPIVIKLPYGSLGVGVFLAENKKTLAPITEMLLNRMYSDPIILQKYYEEAENKDLRLFVIDDKVVAAIQRTAAPGSFRANLAQGGTAQKIEPTKQQKEIAINATKTLGLDYAGVDIIETNQGPKILEINANPMFEGITKTTKVNIPEKIINHTIKRINHIK